MYHIYLIRNLRNGRVYVGQTRGPTRRWSNHQSGLSRGVGGNEALRAAWQTDGPQGFEFVLLRAFAAKEESDIAEADLIRSYTALGQCYNAIPRACGPSERSPETREKIRQANLRNGNRPPSRAGHSPSPEAREKQRQTNLRIGRCPPTFAGRMHSEEAKAKIAASKIGKPGPRTGMTTPPETREKQRAAALRRIERGEWNGFRKAS